MTRPYLFIAPRPPSRWQRALGRLRAWRWRRHGGLSPRWQSVGMYTPPDELGVTWDLRP